MTDKATIRTYATTANFGGPLFDRGGAKVNGLYLETTAELTSGCKITIQSEGDYKVPIDKRNLAHKIAPTMFRDKGIKDGLTLKITSNIKPGGLGTSAASAVAFVELVNCLYELNLSTEEKIRYASLGEPNQHLDNVVPCTVGGIVLATKIEGENLPRFSRYEPPSNLVPALVIPLDIYKEGGTAKARKVIKPLRFRNLELVYASGLAELMIAGIIQNDFEKIRESIAAYSRWEKSVTSVRNKAGVYGVNLDDLNRSLEKAVGKEAISSPSGAGTAVLILAKDSDVAERAAQDMVKMYERMGHNAKSIITSFNGDHSSLDFVLE